VASAYRCDANLGCTFIVWDRDVTSDQWRGHVAKIVADPAFPPGPLLLGDLSTVSGGPGITTDVIEEMVRRWRSNATDLGLTRCAIVATGELDQARQFVVELEGSGLSVMVFDDPWAACTWLGLDTEAARTILKDLRGKLRRPAA
jgi:hypothetical protein